MNKFERKIALEFGAEVFFLVCNVEDLLEEYECEGELTDNQLIKIKRRIRMLKECEKGFKKVLGIEVEE